jgi:DNA-binding transcriptional MerR regulator/effector-binding domain-containing protein
MSTSFSIGEFSRATHLTVKTLRHYHEAGLLVPASVDPHSGYRRYSAEQISLAQIIRRFRGLDMPVNEIHAVLGSPDPAMRNELIAAHLRRLEAELSRTQDAVASLRDILEHPAKDLCIERRRIEAAPAVAIRENLRAKDALSWFLGAMAELRATVKAQNLAPTGVPGGIFANSLFSHGRGEATLFIPCKGTVRPTARLSECLIPQTEIAALVHKGSYSNVDMTYGALATYVARHALPMEGPIREYYLCGPQDTADETAWRTEIGWPIFHTG